MLPSLILLLATLPAAWGQVPAPPDGCAADAKSAACKDQKDAREAFARALKLKKSGHDAEAFDALEVATNLAPGNLEYLTAREMVRQQLVLDHVQRGNQLLAGGQAIEASAEFQLALQLDPSNAFARQQLRDSLSDQYPPASRLRVEHSEVLYLEPASGKQDFHYRGDSRGLIEVVMRAFGIAAKFDDSFVSRPVQYNVEGADFYAAMEAASLLTKSFWTPLSEKQALVAADTTDNHRQFDRMSLRVFYLPDSNTPQELNEILNVLRMEFDIRYITQQPASSTITLRAPQAILDAATQFLETFDAARPQVMLDMQVYEVNQTMLRSLGLVIPQQFQVFNIPASALTALQGTNVQDLINQLIASGGINQANTSAISALLAQLQSQQSSLFSQPVATFGGGKTLMGIPFQGVSGSFNFSDSHVSSLEHLTLRASQNDPATLRVGSRYPILNATFSPIFNTSAISSVIANQSYVAPFPSFNYEDLGITLKATPAIQGKLVSLKLEMEIRSLGAQSFNGVPVIGNRSYTTNISVNDGEQAVMAGMVSESEVRSLSGFPGLSKIPGLSQLTSSRNKQTAEEEILVVITPHIVRAAPSGGSTIWLPVT